MRKSTWMAQLERALSREGMTGAEKRTVLNYYEEMYQDKRDDGAEEEDIIKEFGFPEDVAKSVRENDETSQNEDNAPKYGYEEHNSYSKPDMDFEAQAQYVPYAQSVPPQGAPQYSAPPQQTNNGVGAVSIVRTIVYVLLAIVLFSMGVGFAVGGASCIVVSFTIVSVSAGAWLIVLGIGLVLFAFGCLIFGAAIKFTKSIGGSLGGGAR